MFDDDYKWVIIRLMNDVNKMINKLKGIVERKMINIGKKNKSYFK